MKRILVAMMMISGSPLFAADCGKDAEQKLAADKRKHQTLFKWCVARGRYDDAVEFIMRGVDVNMPFEAGFTPLMAASYNGYEHNVYEQLVDELIRQKADVNAACDQRQTALILAVGQDDPQLNVIKRLLVAKADPGFEGTGDLTPLMTAAKFSSNSGVLKLLLDEGACDHMNKHGKTAEDLAKELGKIDFVELLKQAREHREKMAKIDGQWTDFNPSEHFYNQSAEF